uniref:IgLON family member 5 n=1 Tax=Sarcophilus harrisii TaxID=9305 RepID=A0A7N4PH77_SARHA
APRRRRPGRAGRHQPRAAVPEPGVQLSGRQLHRVRGRQRHAGSRHPPVRLPLSLGSSPKPPFQLAQGRCATPFPRGPHPPPPGPGAQAGASPSLPRGRSCSIDEHVTRVAWLNRSNILYAGNDRWTSDPRVRLLTNSPAEFSILITRVGLGDEGLYTCSFQTRQQPHTAQVYLIVHVPARIVNISSAVTVNEGGNVNLLCLAVGRPEPTVTWRQLRDGFTSEGEILEISDIRRSQAGDYECVTHNGVASAPDSRRVPVTVNYPPTITDVTSARTAVGRTALLRCEAMAVPPADFQWFKDDKQLGGGAAEGLKVQTERTRSMLLFANVSGRHYGNYTCRAANRLGAASASMRLLRPGSLENAASRPPGPLALLSALGWLWWGGM